MNLKRYDIDYFKLVVQRIPVEFRWDDVIALAVVLVSPVVYIYNLLLLFRDQITYKLTITPQVVYLEKMLNDRYDTDLRRIYIVDGSEYDKIFLYRKAELKPILLYRKSEVAKPKTYLYTVGEVSTSLNFDFVVFVPVGLIYNSNEMTSLVSAYKLAGKLFTIQTF